VADYEGLYCTGCEEFKQPAQIADGRCIEHPTLELIRTRERNHFFRLSTYSQRLLQLITSNEFQVEPAIRRNEVVRLLEDGLQDVSISRQRLPWGIPFPGDAEQTVYVWFDALINYLSATGFPEPGYERLWPADLHVIGKGITRFHCIIWPAMLLAAGLELPKRVWAHGYVQWEGAKMSKTAGTAVSLGAAIERYGADALRYFLLREVGFENDGNFSWDRFDVRYTADLADTFGNLVSRALSMVQRYRDGVVPAFPLSGRERGPGGEGGEDPLELATQKTLAEYARAMDAQDLQQGVTLVIELASRANRYVEETTPWKLAKEKKDAELNQVLASLVRAVARLAVLAAPFIPAKAQEIWTAVGIDRPLDAVRLDELADLSVARQRVSKPPPLFPKPVAA
jgi:methionyl-tRNA synthetase